MNYILPMSLVALTALTLGSGANAATLYLGEGRPEVTLTAPPIEQPALPDQPLVPGSTPEQEAAREYVDEIVRDAELEAERIVEEAINELREDTDTFPYDAWHIE